MIRTPDKNIAAKLPITDFIPSRYSTKKRNNHGKFVLLFADTTFDNSIISAFPLIVKLWIGGVGIRQYILQEMPTTPGPQLGRYGVCNRIEGIISRCAQNRGTRYND
jgi:hypothetical protein